MHPNNKITIPLFVIYLLAFVLLWKGSKHPGLEDVPVLFGAGIIVSLVALFDFKSKGFNQAVLIADCLLFLLNLLNFWLAIQMVKSVFGA
ncbi:MAG: hypothetical protein J0I41_07630 [Filimonas sp.]|nr:hypothetical protein [Filimonas sp.]